MASNNANNFFNQFHMKALVILALVFTAHCSMILVGGKQECDLDKDDPAKDLAIQQIE